jgi:hemerythrin-like metal-binding protein
MSPFAWDHSFNVGHREIDRQHKEFLAFMNEVEKLLLISENYRITARVHLLERLLLFAEKHYRLEREILQADKNSDAVIYAHWRRHKSFDVKIYSLYRELLAKRLVLDTDILTTIREEFHNHIKKRKNVIPQIVSFHTPRSSNQKSGISVGMF